MTATRYTISDIKAANKAAGQHFFDRGTMRFFNSRIERGVYCGDGGVFFVTSEQFVGSQGPAPRAYTIRRFHPETGQIHTEGEFNAIRSLETAREIAKEASRFV